MRKLLVSSLIAATTLLTALSAQANFAEPAEFLGNPTFKGCDANGNSKYEVKWFPGIGTSYVRLADNFGHTYGVWSSGGGTTNIAVSKDVLLQLYSGNIMTDVVPADQQCSTPINPPSNAPTNVTASWDQACYGMNTIRWNSVPDATFYKVVKGDGSSLGTSTSTSRLISVPYTQSVRVQACNEGGCSSDSAPVTAQHRPYCL